MTPHRLSVLAATLTLLAGTAQADTFGDAFAAYTRQDYATSLALLKPLATRGDPVAQTLVGEMYLDGLGVKPDLDQAEKWLRPAADGGNPDARKRLEELRRTAAAGARSGSVPVREEDGVFMVHGLINNTLKVDFTIDSAASDISLPAAMVTALIRAGTIRRSDFLGQETFRMADGTSAPARVFRIRTLNIGGVVQKNVIGSVNVGGKDALLGQAFFNRFRRWSIDNQLGLLTLEGMPRDVRESGTRSESYRP